jgi:hypothetical protein
VCGLRGALAAVMVLFAAASMPSASVGAQTVTAALSPTQADTVATVATLTGTASTFYHTLSISVSECTVTNTKKTLACNVYMSASPVSSTLVSNLRWGPTRAGCTKTVASGTTPPTNGAGAANVLVLAVTESGTVPSGSTTIYLCYKATLSWSVAPQRFAPSFYFTVIRQ